MKQQPTDTGFALAGERPPIDPESIAELRDLEGDDGECLFPRLIRMFLEDGPQGLADLHVALAAGDAPAVVRIAHTANGSGGCFGAYRFQELCEAMEQAGKRGDLAALAELLADTERELQRVTAALRTELTPKPS